MAAFLARSSRCLYTRLSSARRTLGTQLCDRVAHVDIGTAAPLLPLAATRCYSDHGHSHGGVPCNHSHSHGSEGTAHGHSHSHAPDELGTVPEAFEEETVIAPAEPLPEDSGLPLVQRVKHVLGANWRGQLSTVSVPPSATGAKGQPQRPRVHGSLVPFSLMPDGQLVVFLDEADAHVQVCKRP